VTEVVAAHTRGVANVEERAQQIRATARAWAEFWEGHLDLDALAWETTELLADLSAADARVDRATETTRHHWEQLWATIRYCCPCPVWGPSPRRPYGRFSRTAATSTTPRPPSPSWS
jgi:hypothetical protein